MLKIMKKTISLFIIAAMLVSVMPVVSMAAESVTIPYTKGRITRNTTDWKNKPYSDAGWTEELGYGTAGNNFHSYFQLDFTGNEDLLKDPASMVTFSVRLGGRYSSSEKCYGLQFYALDDSMDKYATDYTYITFTEADALGMHNVTDAQLVAEREDTSNGFGTVFTETISPERKAALLAALESGDDSIVTIYVKAVGGQSYFVANTNVNANSKLTIDKPSEDEYADYLASLLTWDEISGGQDKSAVTSNLFLPLTYNGATVNWSSDDVTISTNGKIALPKDADKTITLTATLNYKGYTSEPITISDITLKKDELQTVQIAATYSNNVRSLYADKISKYTASDATTQFGTYQQFEIVSGGINADATEENPKGDALAFMQFDLSDYNKIIDVAQSLALVAPSSAGKCQGTTGIVTLLNDSSDNWNDTNMTYNYAVNNGMYSDPGLYTKTEINFTDAPIKVDDAALLSAVKTAIAQDPDEGIISFRFSAANTDLCKLYSGLAVWGDAPYVEISYYGSDLKAAEDYKDTITWDAISTQDSDNVVADLELPSTWYGLPITWTSSDLNVVSNTGEITIGAEAKTAALLATIAGYENVFEITVPAKNIAVKSDSMYSVDELANLNYSTGYVYANEAVPTPCTAIIATYNAEGVLVGITVKNNVTINEGKNIITPTIGHTAFAGAETKLILVDNLTNLTPLAIAK